MPRLTTGSRGRYASEPGDDELLKRNASMQQSVADRSDDDHLQSAAVQQSDAQGTELSDTPVSPWVVLATVVLPVLWGVLVHRIFQHFRTRSKPTASESPRWPDYQI
jgi:cobalamin biosynthesis Mg chelatase CobN